MAKKKEAASNAYQALARASQLLLRAHDPKPAKADKPAEGDAKALLPPTAYAVAAALLALADEAAKEDVVELARKAAEAAAARAAILKADLESLKAKRGDHELRRRELADLAQGYDWTMVHRDKVDYIGPFTLDHAPEGSRLVLGKLKLRSLEYPSGLELFQAVKHERQRLEDAARALWPQLREKLLYLQQGGGTATWAQLAKAFETPEATFKKVEAAALFALVWLRSGALEPGWSASTRPPALAQQSSAVSLPRIDKPGAPDRVFALRIDGPSTQS